MYGDKTIRDKWDGFDYSVISPISLDDLAIVTVILKNEDGSKINITLRIVATAGKIEPKP